MSHNTALGRYGEDLATAHLRSVGMTILERNWRCEIGEIDIVAREADVIVVCEVKTRSGVDYGTPFEAISPAKAERLLRLGATWLRSHDTPFMEMRVDIVGIVGTGRQAVLQHLRGAVE